MDVTSRTSAGVMSAVLAALAGAVVVLARGQARLRQDLRICRDELLVAENDLVACRQELRTARMLE